MADQATPAAISYWNKRLNCALIDNSLYTDTDLLLDGVTVSVAADASNGPITITLPPISNGESGYEVSKVDSTSNTVTIKCSVGDSCVGGGNSVVLTTQSDFTIVFNSDQTPTQYWIVMAARIGGFPPPATVATVAAAAAAALNATVIYQNTQAVQPADTNIGVIAVPSGGSQSNWTLSLPDATGPIRPLVIARVSPVEGPPSTVTVASINGNALYLSGVPSVGLSHQGDYVRIVNVPSQGAYWMVLGCRLAGVAG
jgi:hypothetical protein